MLGAAHGSRNSKPLTLELPVTLNEGTNNISILSVMVGLPVMFMMNTYTLYIVVLRDTLVLFFPQNCNPKILKLYLLMKRIQGHFLKQDMLV